VETSGYGKVDREMEEGSIGIEIEAIKAIGEDGHQ
jgi:hypothetical protein